MIGGGGGSGGAGGVGVGREGGGGERVLPVNLSFVISILSFTS